MKRDLTCFVAMSCFTGGSFRMTPSTAAVDAAARGEFGTMVALKTPDIVLVPLSELAGLCRTVPVDHQLIRTAEASGVNLGRGAM